MVCGIGVLGVSVVGVDLVSVLLGVDARRIGVRVAVDIAHFLISAPPPPPRAPPPPSFFRTEHALS